MHVKSRVPIISAMEADRQTPRVHWPVGRPASLPGQNMSFFTDFISGLKEGADNKRRHPTFCSSFPMHAQENARSRSHARMQELLQESCGLKPQLCVYRARQNPGAHWLAISTCWAPGQSDWLTRNRMGTGKMAQWVKRLLKNKNKKPLTFTCRTQILKKCRKHKSTNLYTTEFHGIIQRN